VTGAAGFVGAHLSARLLALGADLRALVRPSSNLWRFRALGIAPSLIRVDLQDAPSAVKLIADFRPHVVFHLATERDAARLEANSDCNTVVAAAVLDGAASPDLERLVYIGSSLEVPEPTGIGVEHPHGRAKARALALIKKRGATEDLPTSLMRTHYVYGPLERTDKLIPKAIEASVTGAVLSLTPGGIRKRHVFISDLVAACLAVLDEPASTERVYLTTAHAQYANEDLISKMSDLVGKPIRCDIGAFQPRAFDRADWSLTAGPGETLTHWQVPTDIDQGLSACWDAWRSGWGRFDAN